MPIYIYISENNEKCYSASHLFFEYLPFNYFYHNLSNFLKSNLFISHVWFGLVLSIIVGYLMPNPIYTTLKKPTGNNIIYWLY